MDAFPISTMVDQEAPNEVKIGSQLGQKGSKWGQKGSKFGSNWGLMIAKGVQMSNKTAFVGTFLVNFRIFCYHQEAVLNISYTNLFLTGLVTP